MRGRESKRQLVLATATIITVAAISPVARADMVGAAAGAGSGLLVAGPVGAVAGGVIGGFFGRPFWGPPVSRGACWVLTTISVATARIVGTINTNGRLRR